jgi:predicted acyltransferase
VLAGHWVRSSRRASTKAVGLILGGGAGLVVGLSWSRAFPINKSLWTGSYVLFSAGIACLVLALLYWVVDMKEQRGWTGPFLVFGTNAIAAYWLSSLFGIFLDWIVVAGPAEGELQVLKTYLYETFFVSWLSPVDASLAYAIAYLLLWLGLISLLYRRRIFIRI